ncbi:hypothetical protein BD309DRAFT_986143 [Dichomitus squalens]|nr:hypothetical protein BD309DRAFT_986143 [Dichomitus squalens]
MVSAPRRGDNPGAPSPPRAVSSTHSSVATGTGPLEFNTAAPTGVVITSAPPLVSGSNIVITSSSPTQSTSSTPSPSETSAAASSASSKSQLPIGTVIAACVGAFIGVVVLLILFYAWYKRSTDRMTAAARRNAENKAEQQRQPARQFKQLDDQEKPRGAAPPTSPTARDQQEVDANFSMFKKSPSVRSAYTTKTGTEDLNHFDLPQLEFTKYHPTLAQELSLEAPEKPFAVAGRQNSGVSWDGETLGDDSFLSLRSVRVESGTMSPTMVMAKMTPPATSSAPHKWESAEVLQVEEDASSSSQPKNPFAEMAEEQRSRSNNPFFNAQDMQRTSRAMRSRSNSRTSRGQSIVRPDSRATVTQHTNPFLDLHEAVPVSAVEMPQMDALSPSAGFQTKSVPSGASAQAFVNERAMESLIAALDLSKEEVEARLRVVSMQGSTYSAYSENDDSDIATVREFPLPPGTTSRP